jgi:hypothetical protein
MSTRTRVVWVLFAVLALPMAGFFVLGLVPQPLKYRYLIWRVESARTGAEERAAFKIAADWGRIWEVDRIRPEDAVAGRRLSGDYLIRVEWLPSSPYSGRAYAAFRSVTDRNNLNILWEKKYYTQNLHPQK